tara:strand:- start:23032 stop:23868 length:837 start_codon:yes stop_codon:yes gene_type:complete
MAENLDRLKDERMEYYHALYKNSPKWDGDVGLFGKRIIVYCEQGLGDIIQMFRYVENLKAHGRPYIILHCPKQLGVLLELHSWVDEIIDKDVVKLPEHDFHVLSLSLPHLLKKDSKTRDRYICFDERNLDVDILDVYPKIGIAWEGNKTWDGKEKSLFLKFFKPLAKTGGQLFMLQKGIQNKTYIEGAEDLDLSGTELNDFRDTARLINTMDVVVTVDTSILHLAGALDKRTYGLLNLEHDPRWDVKNWYPSVKLLKVAGPWDEDWGVVFNKIVEEVV